MSVKVRPATAEDLEVLQALEQGLIAAERPFDPTIRKDPVRYYNLEDMLSSEDTLVLVAELEGKIVSSGYATLKTPRSYLDHEVYVNLGFMFTLPEYRGRGINALIIDQLRAWALGRGIPEIRLTVYNDNLPAIKAYQKEGFEKHIIEMRWVSKDQK